MIPDIPELPDVKLQALGTELLRLQAAVKVRRPALPGMSRDLSMSTTKAAEVAAYAEALRIAYAITRLQRRASRCLLYTSPSPRDRQKSRMPSSA